MCLSRIGLIAAGRRFMRLTGWVLMQQRQASCHYETLDVRHGSWL